MIEPRPDTPNPIRGVTTPTIRYCLGFLFNEKRNHVLLIEKKRPEWAYNKLNGIGGKLLDDEMPWDGMRREFKKETGLDTLHNNIHWDMVCVMDAKDGGIISQNWKVWVFAAYSDEIWECKTQTDEQLIRVSVKGLPSRCLPNLHWLIPMCLDDGLRENKYAVRSMSKIFESEY